MQDRAFTEVVRGIGHDEGLEEDGQVLGFESGAVDTEPGVT